MKQNKEHFKLAINKIPLIGILFFVLLFMFSSTLYPGGSQADFNAVGFDWINNYWCNLMSEKGMNGELNPGRPYSIFGMIILCLSLMIFFVQFAEIFAENLLTKRTIKFGGILSMLFATLIFTEYHDLISLLSSFFGLFVVIGIIREIYRSNLTQFKISGIFCFFLLGLNNLIYYSQQFIEYLPLIQKITLLIVLIWIIRLNNEMRKRIKTVSNNL